MSAGRIPSSITKRSKQPYRAPISSSFFGEGAPDYVSEILSENTLKSYGIFDHQKVKSLITKIESVGCVGQAHCGDIRRRRVRSPPRRVAVSPRRPPPVP